jgi:hypothetical protein
MSDVGRYLELGLRVGKHVDEFVESYHGPSEISARVEQEGMLAPETLIAEAARFKQLLTGQFVPAGLETEL